MKIWIAYTSENKRETLSNICINNISVICQKHFKFFEYIITSRLELTHEHIQYITKIHQEFDNYIPTNRCAGESISTG